MLLASGAGAQLKIIDTGSTNVPGMTITLENSGTHAMVEHRDGSKQSLNLTKEMCDRLLADLKAAGPLDELPVRHCMKSASFGSSLFIEHAGARSPDLSCLQTDPRSEALKKDAAEMLAIAKSLNAPKRY